MQFSLNLSAISICLQSRDFYQLFQDSTLSKITPLLDFLKFVISQSFLLSLKPMHSTLCQTLFDDKSPINQFLLTIFSISVNTDLGCSSLQIDSSAQFTSFSISFSHRNYTFLPHSTHTHEISGFPKLRFSIPLANPFSSHFLCTS